MRLSIAKGGAVAAAACATLVLGTAPSGAATSTLQRATCEANGTQFYFVAPFSGTTCFKGHGDLDYPMTLPMWKPGPWGAGPNTGWFSYNDANGVEQRVYFTKGQAGDAPYMYIKHLHID
ncbi:hypothetical protein OHS33_00090 [Streptomyces sp. NBC_00536]|uniref:hypothetical protein n=1 Tax=Streptomyces sp. NBC_00536 TaxID=2975769 RepID=UPI002E7FE640|nr:hypothetical protein [Streptomyces sp. NBC_00536]WUC84053.1 hypothetical protein OHS33_00090 [Streptomyces sp. NBC_00536]